MNIRLFENGDQAHIERIMSEHSLQFPGFVIARYPERWREHLEAKESTKNGYYVATTETGNVTGHAGYIYNDEVGLYEIVGVVVSKSCQRQGIGKVLIDTVCDRVRELGEKRIILYTLGHDGNEATLAFYRNIGFETLRFEKDFFRPDYHRVTFLKSIS